MWVLAGGRFRSGSTLQYQMVAAMVERSGTGRRVEWCMPEGFADLADRIEREQRDPSELLVFKTHVCKRAMRERLGDGRAVAVSVHRDLRDVAVSAARKSGVEPTPEYCASLMEQLMACERGWELVLGPETVRTEGFVGILDIRYEDLVRDPAGACLEMASHIGIPCDRERAESIAQQFTPDRQRARIARAMREGRMVTAVAGYPTVHMERELLHPDHLADGGIGVWRRVLSDRSVEVIERIAGAWLVRMGYHPATPLARASSPEGAGTQTGAQQP